MPLVKGSIDAIEGSYLSGWALNEDDPGQSCRIQVSNPNGEVVARGRASRSRPDLAALGRGRTDFAFRVLLPTLAERTTFVISADGVELPNSPVDVGPGLFDGHADCKDGVITGWVTERVSDFLPPVIRAVDQEGRLLGELIGEVDPGADRNFSPAIFRLELPDWAFENKSLAIQLFAKGVEFARCTVALHVVGYIDALTAERCAGWLVSPEAEWRSFTVTAFSGAVTLGSGKCQIFRGDIAGRFPKAGNAGFDFPLKLPDGLALWQPISLRFASSKAELFGGPFVGVRRPGMVALARLAGQGLRRGVSSDGLGFADAALRGALRRVLEQGRVQEGFELLPVPVRRARRATGIRLTIIIPVYRGLELTRVCIESVLANRDPERDRVVVINDLSPEPSMNEILGFFATKPNVLVLSNPCNLGFIKSVNRGLEFCLGGDILLLNSDTRVFPGCFDELLAVLHASAEIGTVTAMSNNATIFSYPGAATRGSMLSDVAWEELAAVALERNRGLCIDVPTAHGFCMLIRDEVQEQVGILDEAFGRGYGEENDFCQRAADLGYRHVAACGVLVEHRESVSFTEEKQALLERNLQVLEQRYPEYTPTIMAFERTDPLRLGRWALDRHRLARSTGGHVLVIESWFGGGSRKASVELQDQLIRPDQPIIWVRAREDGFITVESSQPVLHALFAPDEADALFALLDAARPAAAIIHQMLGYTAAILRRLADWLGQQRSAIYLHDFYTACPRVTLINAVGEFCGVPDVDACERCIGLGGSHEHSKLTELSATQHRALFQTMLDRASIVVTPSQDTASWINHAFPALPIQVVPHRSQDVLAPSIRRNGLRSNIVLLGAIGPHKGANQLLALARHAWLVRPDIKFKVIGYTSCDDELRKLESVSITGPYRPDQLPTLVAEANGCAALFLHGWPETFSYTLTEAAQFGLVPIVPDIGAPAARVREADYGLIYAFPASAKEVLAVLIQYVDGYVEGGSGLPARILPSGHHVDALASLLWDAPQAADFDHDMEPAVWR